MLKHHLRALIATLNAGESITLIPGSALSNEVLQALESADKGPWSAWGDDGVLSEDFTHDAGLKLSGDFGTPADRAAYRDRLVADLNRSHAIQAEEARQLEAAIRGFDTLARTMENLHDTLDTSIGLTVEGPVSMALSEAVRTQQAALEAQFGIGGWLEWWWLECYLGKQPMEAGVNGDPMRLIVTLEDLIQLLLDERMGTGRFSPSAGPEDADT